MNSKPYPESELRQYTLYKQQIGELLRTMLQVFEKAQAEPSIDQCRALLVKLAEDRFNLAVVGQFKRGKSSLMNAIIGQDLLPTGLLPLTSAITTLCYGPQVRVILKRKTWALDQEIPIADLPAFVTEQGNPGNEKGIIEARIEIPEAFLRRGIHFIDTPGIGSSRQDNTATTYAFLPEADAVIFVTSVEAPISEAEERFLKDIRNFAHKLFIVVNKVDLLKEQERRQVLDYIQAALTPILGDGNSRLYPLSAHLGLEAKHEHDPQGIRASGIEDFETDVAAFLAAEKSRLFLTALLERADRLIAEFETAAEPNAPGAGPQTDDLPHLRQTIAALRAAVQSSEIIPMPAAQPPAGFEAVNEKIVRKLEATPAGEKQDAGPVFSLTRTCPVCAAQSKAVFDFFVHWQYALSTDSDARRAFLSGRGFCQVHTWQFQQVAAPQGISAGYAPLVADAASRLRAFAGQPASESAAGIAEMLPSRASCPACRLQRETAEIQIERFLKWLESPQNQPLYQQSLGLCLPHLRAALLYPPDGDTTRFLLEEQASRLEEISEDMSAYLLKREALRRGLLNENETHAWQRALIQLIGERTALPQE